MSSLTTLARPYAKAAFELAQTDSNLAAWDDLLAAVASATANKGMADWLESPKSTPEKAIEIISSVLGSDIDARFLGYLKVLANNERLSLSAEISHLFQQLRQEAEKRLQVRVVSAVALQDEQAERMKAALAKRFDRDITLQNDIDPEVLGGAIIYAGDQVIDGSLIGRLNRLQASLV
jgi:F-type H+-transporting ATPase subunit delta